MPGVAAHIIIVVIVICLSHAHVQIYSYVPQVVGEVMLPDEARFACPAWPHASSCTRSYFECRVLQAGSKGMFRAPRVAGA